MRAAVLGLLLLLGEQGDKPPVLTHPTRQELHQVLLYKLMDRFMVQFDEWVSLKGYNTVPHDGDDHWFAVVVKAKYYPPLWVKFKLNRGENGEYCDRCGNDHNWCGKAHLTTIRKEILRQFERLLVEHRENEEVMHSAIFGEGRLYPLPTKDTDVTTLKPRQSMYR